MSKGYVFNFFDFLGRAVDTRVIYAESDDEAWLKASDIMYEAGYADCSLN